MAKRPATIAANGSMSRGDFEIRDRERDRGGTPFTGTPTSPRLEEPSSLADDVPTEEIIALLGQIGQRLQKSEQERQSFRTTMQQYQNTISGLEGRDEQREKTFRSLQDQLAERESAEDNLRRRQEELEARQLAQSERIEKAAELSDRIEEALAQQARLNRRLDKITQDKARFIRKLERIEETVIETQTALQSKAMVLLTDQNNVQSAVPLRAQDLEHATVLTPPSLAKRPFRLSRRTSAIGALAGVGILVGLGIAGLGALDNTGKTVLKPASPVAIAPTLAPPTVTAAAPVHNEPVSPAPIDNSMNTAGLQPASDNAPKPAMPDISSTAAAPATAPVDATQMTDQQLNTAFDKNPSDLAAAMNAIAPGSTPPSPAPVMPVVQDKTQPPPLPPEAYAMDKASQGKQTAAKSAVSQPLPSAPAPKAANASAPPAETGFDAAGFLKAQVPAGTLTDRIKPDPSLPAAAHELEIQAFKGIPEAQHDLAALYTAGRDGLKANYPKAAAWFLESATGGVANAQYNLGVLYQQGLGVPQNTARAIDWYKMAAQQNHPEADYNLGIAHIEGTGTTYDPVLAARYFRQAAKKGIMEASYNLGLIYENGLLGDAQPDEAIYWYRTGADQGSPEAKAAMNQLAHQMHYGPIQVDKIYARVKSAEQSSGNAVAVADIPMTALDAPVEKTSARHTEKADPDSAVPLPVSSVKPTVPSPDQAITAQIQEQLIRLGLFPGPADGVDSQLTDDAIQSYQRVSGLPQTGKPSQALLVNMLSGEVSKDASDQAHGASSPQQASGTLRPDDLSTPGGT